MSFVDGDAIKIGSLTPLEWWCKPEQHQHYPILSRMAIALLSIPPESAEAERTFSGARRTCSWDRLSLIPRNIETIECLGSWIKEGLIKPNYLNTNNVSTDVEMGDGDDGKDALCTLIDAL
jgi:hypothetical protein